VPRSSAASSAPDRDLPAPIALVGATATGKTAVGILLAEALDTEVIGCDSRQVYRGLDIGTAKPTAAERARVRHHLVDVADPRERFNAARFRECALALFAACHDAGRPPLLVGGTGLYLRATLEGLCSAPPGDAGLRRWLKGLAESLPDGLHPLLARVDPPAAARLHPNDRFRIIRALEVFYLGGEPLSERHCRHRSSQRPAAARVFAIDLPAPELRRRIDQRLETMLADGFLDEARRLLEGGLDPSLPALRAVGYPELFAHLRGETTLAAASDAIRHATGQYARRQRTWFRAVPGVVWISGAGARPAEAIAGDILDLLRPDRAA